MATWIADHKEYVSLLNIYYNVCTVCKAPRKTFGNHENLSGYQQYHTYETLKAELGSSSIAADWKKEIQAYLNKMSVKETYTAFCQLPGINPALLPKLDLLYGMYLSITKHVLGWLYQFLKLYKRVDGFDNA